MEKLLFGTKITTWGFCISSDSVSSLLLLGQSWCGLEESLFRLAESLAVTVGGAGLEDCCFFTM
jgi:hypothetical protein